MGVAITGAGPCGTGDTPCIVGFTPCVRDAAVFKTGGVVVNTYEVGTAMGELDVAIGKVDLFDFALVTITDGMGFVDTGGAVSCLTGLVPVCETCGATTGDEMLVPADEEGWAA